MTEDEGYLLSGTLQSKRRRGWIRAYLVLATHFRPKILSENSVTASFFYVRHVHFVLCEQG